MIQTVKRVLPAAIAVWPMLNELDVFRPVDKNGRWYGVDKRRYVLNLKFSDEDQREVDSWLQDCLANFGVENGTLPWKTNRMTGALTLYATSHGNRPPNAVDVNGDEAFPIAKVKNGSHLKVYVTANPYYGFGGGINLHINAYQIFDLKQKSNVSFARETNRTIKTYCDQCSRPPNMTGIDDIPFLLSRL